MANNHMGDLAHGMRIIHEIHKACQGHNFSFAVKLQYRDLDTLIHPDPSYRAKSRYVQRFLSTRLSPQDFKALRDEIKRLGFLAICTPFDEDSVDLIERHDFDVIKIGSCSFTDWPLLERIAQTGKPLIASTAGAALDDIDKVVAFFEHRKKEFALMHCVGEYPTRPENLELNQIDLLKNRYAGVPIGYSTHEAPDHLGSVAIAIAKGATIFEKHVAVATGKYPANAYSASPEQVKKWLEAAQAAYRMCGVEGGRKEFSDKEKSDLRGLQRGVFSRRAIREGEVLNAENTFLALPNSKGQLVANDLSKYVEYTVRTALGSQRPVQTADVARSNKREGIIGIIRAVSALLKASGITVSDKLEMELSHHYGIDRFYEWGATIINVINREYCKKLIILLPGQKHPVHAHAKKEETFHVLHGDVVITLNGTPKAFKAGDMVVIERGVKHGFESNNGVVFEEISTTHYADDSCYESEEINKNPNRKTRMTFWADWLAGDGKIQ